MADRRDASPPDYYARLGVPPSASTEDIHEAYRKRAQETHPDLNPDDARAAERFRKIQEAYRVLCDPERREAYDTARRSRQGPGMLVITQEAPTGCGGYLWRVLAGVVAVVIFLVFEALGVWAAGPWTILVAVGCAALMAGLIAVAVADWFPDQATDVSLRLDREHVTMWADGQTVLQLPWEDVETVQLSQGGWILELEVPDLVGEGLRSVPPVLEIHSEEQSTSRLVFDLSDTDLRRSALVKFIQSTDAVPRPGPASSRPRRG